MKSSTWWQGEPGMPSFSAIGADRRTDVVVVGAGITGLTCALLLARAGRKVVLLEGDHVGAGSTGHTSAHLTSETDTDLDQLRRRVGEEAACAAVRANRAGIERVAALDREMGGRSGFTQVPGYLFGKDEQQVERIANMAKLYAACGEPATAPVEVPLPGGFRGMRLDEQGIFHPIRYLAGLVDLCVQAGVEIHEGSEVVDWDSGRPVRVVTRHGPTLEAEHVVFATHTPPGMVPVIHGRMLPYLTFLITARPRTPFPPALYWDMENPYHYVRPLADGQVLVGGSDYKPGNGDPFEALRRLEEWARGVLTTDDATARWSHMWFEPADGMPYIGALPTRIGAWVATGFSGTGLTWGSYAAERIAAQILGQVEDTDRHFSPGRLQLLGSVDRLVEEGVSTFWHLVGDRLKPAGDHHPSDLKPGEGKVVSVDGQKLGVYRDEAGELHAVSLTCKHMGCVVGWNPLDRTWDCPCHGGRYRADGTRFWGPPMQDLERRKVEDLPADAPDRKRRTG